MNGFDRRPVLEAIAYGEDETIRPLATRADKAAITLRIYAHRFDAAKHAERAREVLEAQFGSMLK